MSDEILKPRNVPLSDEVRAAIKANQGVLSLAAAAKKFGVSRRTVGRIYHGAELSTAKVAVADVEALRQQVAELTQMVQALSQQVEGQVVQQRFRQALNPDLHNERHEAHASDFSSPYRDRPGMALVRVYGEDVPVPYDWQELTSNAWFVSQNPVSPSCSTYPYPAPDDKAASKGNGEAAVPVVYRDPPAGVSCTCVACKEWRLGLAWEVTILRDYQYAVVERAVWRKCR